MIAGQWIGIVTDVKHSELSPFLSLMPVVGGRLSLLRNDRFTTRP